MSKEYEIKMRDPYSLRVRRRPLGDIEMRLWYQASDGSYSSSLPNGFFIPENRIEQVIKALQDIAMEKAVEEKEEV